MKTLRTFLFCRLLPLALVGPALLPSVAGAQEAAQAEASSVAPTPPASGFVLPDSMQGDALRQLTLQEALQIAVRNNLGIKLSREVLLRSERQIDSADAAFEPEIAGSVRVDDSVSPPQSSLDGQQGMSYQSQVRTWTASLRKRISTGAQMSLDFFSARRESNAGSAVEPLIYGSNVSVSVTQPLLQGFSLDRDVPRANVLRATISSRRSLAQTELAIAQEVQRTENAYWDLSEAIRSFGVQKASLALAEQQLDLTQRQIDAGILAPADRIASESQVAQRQLSLVQAEASLRSRMDILRQVLNLETAEWSTVLLAVDEPTLDARELTLDEAMASAQSKRPEIRQNRLDQELAALNTRLADNQRLPQLDLGVSYGLAGQDTVFGGSVSQLSGFGNRSWGVFLNLSWTPLGEGAKAQQETARSSARTARLEYEQFLVNLRTELRSALLGIETARRQVAASEKFRVLAEQSLDAERKRFMSGKSRNIEVSRREDELARARTEELSARIAYIKAAVALDRAMGTLLDEKQIEIRAK